MSINAFFNDFPESDPLVEPQTGRMTQRGLFFFRALWNRTGMGSGIIPLVSPPLVASGTTQADALALTFDWNDIETTAAGTGVLLLPLKPGQDQEVFNGGVNGLNVWPQVGSKIDALAVNGAFALAAGKFRVFQWWSLTQIRSFGN